MDGCHMNGDSVFCWTDCECTFGKAREMYDDGNPGSCIAVGGGGDPGGDGTGGCTPQRSAKKSPFNPYLSEAKPFRFFIFFSAKK